MTKEREIVLMLLKRTRRANKLFKESSMKFWPQVCIDFHQTKYSEAYHAYKNAREILHGIKSGKY